MNKFFGIIALIAVIGFSTTACKDDDDKKDDGVYTVEETVGKLTITNIATKYNNKYVFAFESTVELIAVGSIDVNTETIKGGKVNNGTVVLKVWRETDTAALNYKGNDKNVTFMILILNIESMNADTNDITQFAGMGSVTVDFTNGIGTGSFSEEEIEIPSEP